MLYESDHQILAITGGRPATHAIVPVGVGSVAQAVVQHFKSPQKAESGRMPRVMTVEPDTAAGLKTSMEAGRMTTVKTQETIMCGMNCGTVSTTSWPVLKLGIDVGIEVADGDAHRAVEEMERYGIEAGPCGAATLAALRRGYAAAQLQTGLDRDSVIVLYCTEGRREYRVPQPEA